MHVPVNRGLKTPANYIIRLPNVSNAELPAQHCWPFSSYTAAYRSLLVLVQLETRHTLQHVTCRPLLYVIHRSIQNFIASLEATNTSYSAACIHVGLYYRPSEMHLLYFSTVGFFYFYFLSVAFPARPYIQLSQPVPISKGRRGGCYLKYDPFENSSHVGRYSLAPKMCAKLSRKMTPRPAKQLAYKF